MELPGRAHWAERKLSVIDLAHVGPFNTNQVHRGWVFSLPPSKPFEEHGLDALGEHSVTLDGEVEVPQPAPRKDECVVVLALLSFGGDRSVSGESPPSESCSPLEEGQAVVVAQKIFKVTR